MAIQFDRQGNYSRRLEAGLKVPKSWVLSVECALCAVAGNCIPAPKGRWQLPLSNIDETEGPRRGKEKYSQTLDSLSEYFMTDKWKRLHLVHFLLKIRGKIKGQRTFIPKAQKSWHLSKIIKIVARRHRHLQIDSKCLAHAQLSHLAQFVKHYILNRRVGLILNPLPNEKLEIWKLYVYSLWHPCQKLQWISVLCWSPTHFTNRIASAWLTCPAAWVKRLSVIIHFYKLEEQKGFFRPPICWQRDFIGYISLAFLLNSSLFYEK